MIDEHESQFTKSPCHYQPEYSTPLARVNWWKALALALCVASTAVVIGAGYYVATEMQDQSK